MELTILLTGSSILAEIYASFQNTVFSLQIWVYPSFLYASLAWAAARLDLVAKDTHAGKKILWRRLLFAWRGKR